MEDAFYDEDALAMPENFTQAAYSVAILLVGATLILMVMKKSGFRAMVAVGRS